MASGSSDSRLPFESPNEERYPLHDEESDKKLVDQAENSLLVEQQKQTPSRFAWLQQSNMFWGLLAGVLAIALLAFVVPRSSMVSNLFQPFSIMATEPVPLSDKPKADKRLYQYSVLPNGLQVVNVQDKDSNEMGMAVAVRAGSYDDPKEFPGLAHFCEHMLFLGTEKYPIPSDFDVFLSKFGGSSNAYTASEVTVYYATASKAAEAEGLDRFADFFRAPLFKSEFVKKEVNAINSEHEKNLQSNTHRIVELLNFQADPKSVVPRFSTGDVETLYNGPARNGSSPVDALKTYFKHRYCPQMMRLVTFGSQSLDDQLQMTKKAGFGQIPEGEKACSGSLRSFAEPKPFTSKQMGQMLLVQGTQSSAQLWLHFSMPDVTQKYASKPITYLNYVINYRGENSLYRVLGDGLGLVTSLDVSADASSAGTSFYIVSTLTDTGFSKPEAVMDVIFSYLTSMRKSGIDQALYQSIADMVKLKWEWSEQPKPTDTVSGIAEAMTRLPRDQLLLADDLITKPDSDLIKQLLQLIQPANMNVALVTPSGLGSEPLDKVKSTFPIQTLPYYGVKYVKRTLNEVMPGSQKRWDSWLDSGRVNEVELRQQLIAKGIEGTEAIELPPRMPRAIQGIPKEVSLKYMRAVSDETLLKTLAVKSGGRWADKIFGPVPSPLSDGLALAAQKPLAQSNTDVWYRPGWMTSSPKVSMSVSFRVPRTFADLEISATDAVRFSIYDDLLRTEIDPKLVDLTAAGSTFGLATGPNGITVQFDGFAEALPNLISQVLKAFNSFNEQTNVTTLARFTRSVTSMRKDLTTYNEMPVKYASHIVGDILTPGQFSREEYLAAIDKSFTGKEGLSLATRTLGDLILPQPLQVTALAMGNVDKPNVQSALSSITGGLELPSWATSRAASAKAVVQKVTPVVNPSGPVEIRVANPRAGDPNDVASVTILYGVSDVEGRVLLGLLSSILGTAAFDELRTQRQLGYVVSAGSGSLSNVLYVTGVVQGTKVKADEAEAALEGLFTSIMPQKLQELSSTDFAGHVDAYRQEILEPPLGKSAEFSHFWTHIAQGGDCMYLLDEVLNFLNSPRLTKQLLIDTWEKIAFGKQVGTATPVLRKKISVKYFSTVADNKGSSLIQESEKSYNSQPKVSPPSRPSLDEVRALWKKQGVAKEATSLLEREWQNTKVFDKADSTVRKELLKDGAFYPTDLNCRYKPTAASLEERDVLSENDHKGNYFFIQAQQLGQKRGKSLIRTG